MNPTPEITVRQVMEPNPVMVEPDRPIQDVLDAMNARRIGSVLVVRADGGLAGIFTERDLLRRVATADAGWRDRPVSDWMTPDPFTIGPDLGWDDAVGLMERLRVRHLPVVDAGRVIGLVSNRRLVSHRAEYLNRRVEERTAELRRAYEQLLARDAEVLHYLRSAGRLQRKAMLPQTPPEWAELRWAVHYAPLDHLGGDYYDFAVPSPDHLGVLIADASGHSIPAAMVAIMTRFAFIEAAGTTVHPGEVLGRMNTRLQELSEERFVTAFYGVFDRRTGSFRYASAGHPHPLRHEAKSGTVRPLSAQGFMLGVMPDEMYAEREVRLEPGDRVCFYTDGLVEARNEIGELFGVDRLIDCLARQGREPSGAVLNHVLEQQREFSGTVPLADDLTALVVEVVPEAQAV